jgi:hypothetical protein
LAPAFIFRSRKPGIHAADTAASQRQHNAQNFEPTVVQRAAKESQTQNDRDEDAAKGESKQGAQSPV